MATPNTGNSAKVALSTAELAQISAAILDKDLYSLFVQHVCPVLSLYVG